MGGVYIGQEHAGWLAWMASTVAGSTMGFSLLIVLVSVLVKRPCYFRSEWAISLSFQLQVCSMIGRMAGPLAGPSAVFSSGFQWANFDVFPWVKFYPEPAGGIVEGDCGSYVMNAFLMRLCQLSSSLLIIFVWREAVRRVFISRHGVDERLPDVLCFPNVEVPAMLIMMYPLTDVIARAIATRCTNWIVTACVLFAFPLLFLSLGAFGKAVYMHRARKTEGVPPSLLEEPYNQSSWGFFAVEFFRKIVLALILGLTVDEARAVLCCMMFGTYLGLLSFFMPMRSRLFMAQCAFIACADTISVAFAASPVYGWTDEGMASSHSIIFALLSLMTSCAGLASVSIISLTPYAAKLMEAYVPELDLTILSVMVDTDGGPQGTASPELQRGNNLRKSNYGDDANPVMNMSSALVYGDEGGAENAGAIGLAMRHSARLCSAALSGWKTQAGRSKWAMAVEQMQMMMSIGMPKEQCMDARVAAAHTMGMSSSFKMWRRAAQASAMERKVAEASWSERQLAVLKDWGHDMKSSSPTKVAGAFSGWVKWKDRARERKDLWHRSADSKVMGAARRALQSWHVVAEKRASMREGEEMMRDDVHDRLRSRMMRAWHLSAAADVERRGALFERVVRCWRWRAVRRRELASMEKRVAEIARMAPADKAFRLWAGLWGRERAVNTRLEGMDRQERSRGFQGWRESVDVAIKIRDARFQAITSRRELLLLAEYFAAWPGGGHTRMSPASRRRGIMGLAGWISQRDQDNADDNSKFFQTMVIAGSVPRLHLPVPDEPPASVATRGHSPIDFYSQSHSKTSSPPPIYAGGGMGGRSGISLQSIDVLTALENQDLGVDASFGDYDVRGHREEILTSFQGLVSPFHHAASPLTNPGTWLSPSPDSNNINGTPPHQGQSPEQVVYHNPHRHALSLKKETGQVTEYRLSSTLFQDFDSPPSSGELGGATSKLVASNMVDDHGGSADPAHAHFDEIRDVPSMTVGTANDEFDKTWSSRPDGAPGGPGETTNGKRVGPT